MHHAGEECSLHISSKTQSWIFLIGVGPVILGGHKQARESSKTIRFFLCVFFFFITITAPGNRDASQKWSLMLVGDL